MIGEVIKWLKDGGFGWLACKPEEGGGERQVFMHWTRLTCDALGRRRDCTIPGTLVDFELAADPRYPGKSCAHRVCPLFREPILADVVDKHRECSRIEKFIQPTNGWLHRADDESIFFRVGSVNPEDDERIRDLKVGDFVWHGVGVRPSGDFEARPIELYSADEQEALQKQARGEVFSAVQKVHATPKVLLPENRGRTLKELCGRKS